MIVSIEPMKRNRHKFEVKLNGEISSFFLVEEVMVKYHIEVGKPIEIAEMMHIQEESDVIEGFSKALKLLERTMKTEKEISQYLLSKKFCESAILRINQKLKEYGYIQDLDYAKLYVSRACQFKGKRMVEYELKQKGVADSFIHEATSQIGSEAEVIQAIATKYMKNKPKTKENQAKLFRHLLGKGFEMEEVKTVVKHYGWEETEHENWN